METTTSTLRPTILGSQLLGWLTSSWCPKDRPMSSLYQPRDFRIPGSARASLGQVASLIESRFSSKEGERGLWEPNAFLRDYFVGTYF